MSSVGRPLVAAAGASANGWRIAGCAGVAGAAGASEETTGAGSWLGVATVDNLPRETAPTRVLPWQPVPGAFAVAQQGDDAFIDAGNAARYEPYIRVAQRLDSRALVKGYVDSYPLFQRAYEELGYPNRYFNDRLMEAIDNLLEAPELPAPAKLARPKVLYEFADPELQHLSAGQKLMMRMGRDNEIKLKAKLREIRAELIAASPAQ